jgi:tetratricopeptide (TPR) repeat protein
MSKKLNRVATGTIEAELPASSSVNAATSAKAKKQKAEATKPFWLKHLRLIILIAIFIPLGSFGGRQIYLNYHTDQVKKAIANFDDRAALVKLRELEKKTGKTGQLEYLRSRTYRHLANYEKALQHLDLAKQLKFTPELIRREQMLLDAQQGYVEDPEKDLERLLMNAGSDIGEVCLAFTYGYLIRMRFQEALGMIGLWKRNDSKSPHPAYLTALMAQYQRQWDVADKLLDESLKLQPDFLPGILAKAQNKSKMSQFAEAVPYYKQYLARVDDNAEAKRGMAEALFGSGAPGESLTLLRELIDGGDRTFETRLLLGKSQLETGDAQGAVDSLVPLSQLWPDDVDLNYTLSRAYSQLGQEERANVHLAAMETGRKKLENIDLRLREAEMSQDNPMLRYEMGHLLLHYSSREEGRVWLQSALMQNPGILQAHQDLEQYFTRTGDSAMALYHRSIIKKMGGEVQPPPNQPANNQSSTPKSS